MATRKAPHNFTARRVTVLVMLVAIAALIITLAIRHNDKSSSDASHGSGTSTSAPTSPAQVGSGHATQLVAYSEQALDPLSAPVQYPAAADFAGTVRLAGGLTPGDASTARIVAVTESRGQLGTRLIGQLPVALHDAAGAGLGSDLYVFGGGYASGQLDSIVRVDASGHATTVGRLPAASSDSAAATIGGTAYVVGGYDGTHWLDTILAFTPGSSPRVVAHLPVALRYAAVSAVDGQVVIAGGTPPGANASAAVYTYDPHTGSVATLGRLPISVAHASAAALGTEVVVAGGRDASGNLLDTIYAIDPATKRIRLAGHLLAPRSDAALVPNGASLLLLGGRNGSGPTTAASIVRAQPVAAPASDQPAGQGVYAFDGPNQLNATTRAARYLIYVPNSLSDTVDVIDPNTMRIVEHFAVGALPQHVTPAWNLRTLYVDNDRGDSLTPIDPTTGLVKGPPIPVTDPYNLYFTLDGKFAIVVAERFNRLDFRNPNTMQLVSSVPVPCSGVDHMDYTASGSLALASCEFSGTLIVVDVQHRTVVRTIALPHPNAKPQDVKLSPDGRRFYVADMNSGGVWVFDASTFANLGFIATDRGAHGLYPSRDARELYVTNRDAGTISVLDFATGKLLTKWTIPGSSPDMGGVSPDGRVLWLSGRYNREVYAISTTDGHVIARIPVGNGPHGVSVWPQPGRFSLGHTGIMR